MAAAAAAGGPVAAAAVLVDVDNESASNDDSLVGGFSFSPYITPTQNTQHFFISTMPLSHKISAQIYYHYFQHLNVIAAAYYGSVI